MKTNQQHKKMTIDYTNYARYIARYIKAPETKGFVTGLEMVWELFKAVMSAALRHCRWIILLIEQQEKEKTLIFLTESGQREVTTGTNTKEVEARLSTEQINRDM